MAHEVSVTVSRTDLQGNERWYVEASVGKNKGKVLGPREGFQTEKKATAYAVQRSKNYGARRKRRASSE